MKSMTYESVCGWLLLLRSNRDVAEMEFTFVHKSSVRGPLFCKKRASIAVFLC